MVKNSQNANSDLDGLSFEQALGRLEETVQALETGGLTLADATCLFERGVKLARLCSELLASAELKISQIQTSYGEQMRLLADEKPGSEE